MKKAQIEVGAVYAVKVSGKVAPVKIIRESFRGGWDGTNMTTGRAIRIKLAQKCRYRVKVG